MEGIGSVVVVEGGRLGANGECFFRGKGEKKRSGGENVSLRRESFVLWMTCRQ